MPVERHASPPASDRLWLEPGDPRIAGRLRRMWSFTLRLVPIRPRAGLRKYRSTVEADAAREAWEAERIQRLAERRRAPRDEAQG